MGKTFFTSDQHFSHKNIMKYCDRDFRSVHDMNVELTRAWNDTVGSEDDIWFLGDIAMNKQVVTPALDRLNGNIHVIYGNHDRKMRGIIKAHPSVVYTGDIAHPTFDKTSFTLCHYAMRVWNASHRGAIHLYGHSHGTLPPEQGSMDVGVDNAFRLLGEYRPFSLEEVKYFTSTKGTPKREEVIHRYARYIFRTMSEKLDWEEISESVEEDDYHRRTRE